MDKYERNIKINNKKRLRKYTGAVYTTNPARWRLGTRLRLGTTSQLLQFGRGHPSHFYQLCVSCQANLNDKRAEAIVINVGLSVR